MPTCGFFVAMESGLIDYYMNQLEKLPVGMDLAGPSRLYEENYLKALNDILEKIRLDVDGQIVTDLLASFRSDGSFPNIFLTKNKSIIGLKTAPDDAVNTFVNELHRKMHASHYPAVRSIILNTLADWNIAAEIHFPDLGGTNSTMVPIDGLFNIESKDVDSLFDSLANQPAPTKGLGRWANPAAWRRERAEKTVN